MVANSAVAATETVNRQGKINMRGMAPVVIDTSGPSIYGDCDEERCRAGHWLAECGLKLHVASR